MARIPKMIYARHRTLAEDQYYGGKIRSSKMDGFTEFENTPQIVKIAKLRNSYVIVDPRGFVVIVDNATFHRLNRVGLNGLTLNQPIVWATKGSKTIPVFENDDLSGMPTASTECHPGDILKILNDETISHAVHLGQMAALQTWGYYCTPKLGNFTAPVGNFNLFEISYIDGSKNVQSIHDPYVVVGNVGNIDDYIKTKCTTATPNIILVGNKTPVVTDLTEVDIDCKFEEMCLYAVSGVSGNASRHQVVRHDVVSQYKGFGGIITKMKLELQ